MTLTWSSPHLIHHKMWTLPLVQYSVTISSPPQWGWEWSLSIFTRESEHRLRISCKSNTDTVDKCAFLNLFVKLFIRKMSFCVSSVWVKKAAWSKTLWSSLFSLFFPLAVIFRATCGGDEEYERSKGGRGWETVVKEEMKEDEQEGGERGKDKIPLSDTGQGSGLRRVTRPQCGPTHRAH